MTGGGLQSGKKLEGSCDVKSGGTREGFFKDVLAMRRGSIGPSRGPALQALDEVVLRGKNPPPPCIGPGFMRRSCTFVTEGSWRKSSFGIGSGGQKENKDRVNLALQVRKKAAQLGDCDENSEEGDTVDSLGRGPGRVSRLVGNLKSWSSSEDVRQSVVGAFARTVSVIKQRPGSRKAKEPLAKTKSTSSSSSSSSSSTSSVVNHKTTRSAATTQHSSNSGLRAPKDTPLLNGTKGGKAGPRPMPIKTPLPKKRSAQQQQQQHQDKVAKNPPNYMKSKLPHKVDPPNTTTPTPNHHNKDKRWWRHLHEAQASYNLREGRHRRPHPAAPHLTDPEQQTTPHADLRDVEDDADNSESLDATSDCLSSSQSTKPPQEAVESSFNNSTSVPQAPSSPESVTKKTELLRRKDLKIRQELEEKQNLIADILNIPRQDFESVADMAGEVGMANKEPKELVLGAIDQAKKLQETLNEAQTIRDSDVIAAQACTDILSKGSSLPLYNSSMDTMEKLLNISGTLTQFLNSLMIIICERDEERDRMRKELVASRERVHQLHMQQNLVDNTSSSSAAPSQSSTAVPPTIETTSPHSSRPCSFVSVNSSVADHSDTTDQHNTDEEGKSDDPANSSTTEVQSASEATTEKCCGETSCDTVSLAEDDEPTGAGSSGGEGAALVGEGVGGAT